MAAPKARKKIEPAKAWRMYAKMPAEARSANALHAALKAQGYSIARNTINSWVKEGKWDEKAATIGEGLAKNPDTIEASIAANAVLETTRAGGSIEDVLERCGQMAVGLAATTLATIASVAPVDVADIKTLAQAAVDVAKAMAEVRKTMAETPGAQTAPSAPVAGPASFDDLPKAEQIAILQERRKKVG